MLKDILAERFTAKWWTNTPVEEEKINDVLQCAYLAPSKQGKFNHKIYVITDSPEGKALKDWLYFEDTYCLDGIRGKVGPGLKRYNGQVTAPVVLLWIADKYSSGAGPLNENENQRVRDDCIVSATMAMCAAEELGLQTGFNACLGGVEIPAHLNMPNKLATIAIGIGYAEADPRVNREIYQGAVHPVSYPNSDPKVYPNAYQLILANKTFIIEESVKRLATERVNSSAFKNYQYDESKCYRDLEFVFDALLHDIQFSTNMATRTIISEYWSYGRPQVRRIGEPFVYQFIRKVIAENILTNIPLTQVQNTVATQFIDQALVPESGSATFINGLIVMLTNGIVKGSNRLPVIGNDFANTVATNRTGPNRKNRPAKELMINYI